MRWWHGESKDMLTHSNFTTPREGPPFPTQDEAEAHAIGMATQWIDGGKPGFNAEGE